METTTDTLIIGAGISGLTAAYQLHRAGLPFMLIEASPQGGGLIRSEREAGYLLEWGPHTFPSTATEIVSLCDELGLRPKTADQKAKKRYLFLNSRLTALPTHPLQAITTPVLSLAGKLRLLQEPFQRKTCGDDISVAEFLKNRVGREVMENLADPFISGIYAGDIASLSLPAVFPKLWQWEQSTGSLLTGAKAAGGKDRKRKQKRQSMTLLSFEDGLQTFTQALQNALPAQLCRFGQSVREISKTADGYKVALSSDNEVNSAPLYCKKLILATPADTSSQLLASIDPETAHLLKNIPYNGLSVVHLGFPEAALSHELDGFGVLVPRKEKITLLGAIWSSSLFPERAPSGHVLLSCFIGGAHHPDVMNWPDEKVQEQVLSDLQTLFQAKKPLTPTFSKVIRYEKAIPQYQMGHLANLEALEQRLKLIPGLSLCGNYLRGISLNECVKSGILASQM